MKTLSKVVKIAAILGLLPCVSTKGEYWYGQYSHSGYGWTNEVDYVQVPSSCSIYYSGTVHQLEGSAWLTVKEPLNGDYVVNAYMYTGNSTEGSTVSDSVGSYEVRVQSGMFSGAYQFSIQIWW